MVLLLAAGVSRLRLGVDVDVVFVAVRLGEGVVFELSECGQMWEVDHEAWFLRGDVHWEGGANLLSVWLLRGGVHWEGGTNLLSVWFRFGFALVGED